MAHEFKYLNGELVRLSDAEIAEHNAKDTAWANDATNRAWASIRKERNVRLAATDFYALSDVTLADNMKTYRQALRDLPANTADPAAFETQWNDFLDKKAGVSDPWPQKP
jgi:hypothetical protein